MKDPYAHKKYSTKSKMRRAAKLSNNKAKKGVVSDVETMEDLSKGPKKIKATPRHAKGKIIRRGTKAKYYDK